MHLISNNIDIVRKNFRMLQDRSVKIQICYSTGDFVKKKKSFGKCTVLHRTTEITNCAACETG